MVTPQQLRQPPASAPRADDRVSLCQPIISTGKICSRHFSTSSFIFRITPAKYRCETNRSTVNYKQGRPCLSNKIFAGTGHQLNLSKRTLKGAFAIQVREIKTEEKDAQEDLP